MDCRPFLRRLAMVPVFSIVSFVTVCAQSNKADSLKPGDPAPAIVVRKWIKGNPVAKFKPGVVYVVEFWATWCGPCQAAMPHLSELAQKYKGKAEVLSIDVMEESVMKDKKVDFLPKVERFVKWSGTRMNYTVAVDAREKNMEKTWLNAAGVNGIPAIFIVDKEGRIAWQGHPDYVDDVLDAVVNDQYDEFGKQQIERLKKEKSALYDSLSKAIIAYKKIGNYRAALVYAEKAMAIFPSLINYYSGMKYDLLSHIDSIKARQFGDQMMTQLHPKDQLGQAYMIFFAQPDSAYYPDYDFALKWAKRAAAHSDPADKGVISMLAKGYHKTGNKEKAVYYQKKYLQLLKKDPEVKPAAWEQAERVLAQYRNNNPSL